MDFNTQPEACDPLILQDALGSDEPGSMRFVVENARQSVQDFLLTAEALQTILPTPLLTPKPTTVLMQSGKSLSSCLIWDLLENYYATLGPEAWDDLCPCYITSSAIIAEAYAETIIAFLEDSLAHLQQDEPVYMVEMASGIGRFSFLLLLELEKKLDYFPHLKGLQFRYIMTDFTQKNIDFWRKHEKFAPFLQKGWLDFALFRPEEEQSLQLQLSGQTLDSTVLKNPLIAIANYFFDTIRHDVFRISGGKLHEGLVQLKRTLGAGQPDSAPFRFDELEIEYEYQELPDCDYYDEPELNQILQSYRDTVYNGSIIFPVGAMRVLDNLQVLSNHNLVLLSSDKSYTSTEHMLLYPEHTFAVHDSISFMVNYHAIGRFFENKQGHYFRTNNHAINLQTVCCVLNKNLPDSEYNRLNYHFNEKLHGAYAIWGMYELSNEILKNEDRETSTEQIGLLLHVLRTNLADPTIFGRVARQLAPILEALTHEQKNDLIHLMQVSWDKFYFYRGEQDLGYLQGELYFAMGMYEESLRCYEVAKRGYIEHSAEYIFCQGRCFEKLNQWQLAKHAYEQALLLNPDYQECANALNALRAYRSFD
jgi:hypothetical protein